MQVGDTVYTVLYHFKHSLKNSHISSMIIFVLLCVLFSLFFIFFSKPEGTWKCFIFAVFFPESQVIWFYLPVLHSWIFDILITPSCLWFSRLCVGLLVAACGYKKSALLLLLLRIILYQISSQEWDWYHCFITLFVDGFLVGTAGKRKTYFFYLKNIIA